MDEKAGQAEIHIGATTHPKDHLTLLNIMLVFGVVAIALMATFRAADWYANNVSLRRYCGEAEASVALVHRILAGNRPAGAETTQPYIVAAKLLYLVPQRQGESAMAYLVRLRNQIETNCR